MRVTRLAPRQIILGTGRRTGAVIVSHDPPPARTDDEDRASEDHTSTDADERADRD